MKEGEGNGGIAAFFDLDGTLLAEPSLERRFLADLRAQRAIPIWNYILWLGNALRLLSGGIGRMRYANKMYLRGLRRDGNGPSDEQHPRRSSGRAKMAVPRFLPAAMERVTWHARQGHGIILVSGTLAPLANEMAIAIVMRLAVRGIRAAVGVCATQLEERNGRWTGRIIGDAMYGDGKARAVKRIAAEGAFDLSQCYAYGNCSNDRWMLEAVGYGVAVNPSRRMESLARRRGWKVVRWTERDESMMSGQRLHGTDEAEMA